MKNLRTHGKSTIVWLLMGMLVLGLGGFGVTSFSGGSSEIGSVGGTKVTANDYARALTNQIQAYSQQAGQQVTMAQAQAIGLPQSIQAQLFTAAALGEQARRIGVSVGDQRVVRSISQADGFKGPNGSFDRAAYGAVLRNQGLSEGEFEEQVRQDEARLLLQRAVIGGVTAPQPLVEQTAGWLLERRDISWHELTEEELAAPVEDPDEATLKSWHEANAARFTAPETRKITYVWLTPEMLQDEVDLDEAALRDSYEQRIDEFQQPERRITGRLIFPSLEEAEAAKARLDSGEVPFETIIAERGLSVDEIDLGEMTQDDLGAAGESVFALDGPGVVGPIQTDLGPALFSMNAILDPIDISFEQAQADLRGEAALDRAARMIDDRLDEYEDLLAGGATLEDVAAETPMELAQIDWSDDMNPDHGSIAAYPAFREQAVEVTENDFPTLERLNDGGIFAMRLDEVVAPTLIAFDEIRDEVAEDWRAEEQHRQLLARAEERRVEAAADPVPETDQPEDGDTAAADDNSAPVALTWTQDTDLTRDGWIDGLPMDVLTQAFAIDEPGSVEVVDAGNRVFLVRLDAVHAADLGTEDGVRVSSAVQQRLGQSLQTDIFDYYARAAQRQAGIEVNQSAINAINAQIQ
ncbi:peptidylprolyl isomerase [Paracoccus homiensis]|uniref:Peptidyl-prolyl cis-trans isomerase D n=1 Tax=Paracoccus homiensis TaxID=364199 RepID=A0A1I0FH82_9RHOB|nr:peptidylprolyl isomerase [Paracoccus homiensis]SET57397.1 peptidyl-prolyl cis-trans isomerase D [Paracoccus homiensis]